jgi:hypothetical protein
MESREERFTQINGSHDGSIAVGRKKDSRVNGARKIGLDEWFRKRVEGWTGKSERRSREHLKKK